MKVIYAIIALLIIIFILGFGIAALIPAPTACTEMACLCMDVEGEIPCNWCFQSKPVFTTGVINVMNSCDGREIITCENGEQVGQRIELDLENCTIDWYVLGTNLRYIGTNPEETISSTALRGG